MLLEIEALDPLHCVMMNIAANCDVDNRDKWVEVDYQGRKVKALHIDALSLFLTSYLQRCGQVATA